MVDEQTAFTKLVHEPGSSPVVPAVPVPIPLPVAVPVPVPVPDPVAVPVAVPPVAVPPTPVPVPPVVLPDPGAGGITAEPSTLEETTDIQTGWPEAAEMRVMFTGSDP